jgi:hypothetical protein
MEEHENDDSIDSDLSLGNSSDDNRKTVVLNFNANIFKKEVSPLLKRDVQDDQSQINNNSFVNTIEKVRPPENEIKESSNKSIFPASDCKRNTISNKNTSNFSEEDSSIKKMKGYFNRSASFRIKHKMRFSKEEATNSSINSTTINLEDNYKSNHNPQTLNLNNLSEDKLEGEEKNSAKKEEKVTHSYRKYNSEVMSATLTKFNLEEKEVFIYKKLHPEHHEDIGVNFSSIQEVDKSMEQTFRGDDFIKNIEIISETKTENKQSDQHLQKIEKLQEDLLNTDQNKSELLDEKDDEELEDDVGSLSKSSSPLHEDSEDFDRYSITETPRVEMTERKFQLDKEENKNIASISHGSNLPSPEKSIVNNLTPLSGEPKLVVNTATTSNSEQTIINNNYNININLSKNDVDEDTELILRRISSKLRFNSNTNKENISVQEQNVKNEFKTENPRGSGIVKRLNLTNLNEIKNNEINGKIVKHPVIEERVDKIEYNSSSKAEELKRRIRSSIIDKLMHENSYAEEESQTEDNPIEENLSEEVESSQSDNSEEKSKSYSSYEQSEYDSEVNDSIVDLNDGDFNGSFLKEMLIETNRQYIKDKVSSEDKIKEAASITLFDIVYLKIKAINIYSFLRIQCFNKLKIKNYKIPLLNCFKIANFRRIENLRNNLRKFKRIKEDCKKAEENKGMDILRNLISELGIEKNFEKLENHLDLAKILNVKIKEYLKKNDKSSEFRSVSCINLEFKGIIKEKQSITDERNNEIQKIPAVPGSEKRAIPNVPSVPGIPFHVIPQVPQLPNSNIPSVPSVPGISIQSVPKVPNSNIPSVPSLPGVSIPPVPQINNNSIPSVPSVPQSNSNIPIVPGGIPSVPGVQNIPSIPSIPGIPKVPGVPQVPGVPNIPSVPGVPSIPGVPQVPGISNIPNIPGVTKVPGVPSIPGVPQVPGIPNIPSIPGVPKVPGLPSIPGVPGLPKPPSVPGVPGIPSIPGVPGIPGLQRPPVPGVPGAPSIPGIPGMPRPPMPGVPSLPGVPGLPRMPGVPSMPGVPGLPRMPGAPSIPGLVRPGVPGMPGFPMGMPMQSGPVVIIPKPPKDTNPKKIFWNMIPKNKLQPTFWIKEKLDAKVDYENLCKYFCEPKKKAEDKKPGADAKQETTAPVNTVVKILDDKRLMNLAIALSKVAITNDNLKDALENFEEEKLTLEMIDKIISLAPNSEEIEKLRDYKGDINVLSNGERFCMALMNVNRFLSRLECIKYKKMIDAEKEEILNKIKVLREGIISIKGSKNFKNVLKCILVIGNYLNSDTAKGNAQGVSVNTLAMLEGVKGIGKEKYTLLDFLVINIKAKEPSLINFYKDFSNLEEVLAVDISDIESKIKEFENGLKKLKKEKDSLEKEKDKSLVAKFSAFVNDLELLACDKFDEIMTAQDSLTKEISDTIEFFGEEVKQFKIGDFLKLINDFVENFKKTATKLSAEEAKQLKKQIKEDKNKKEETKNKHNKELEKIRKTAVKKTLARKSNYKNFSHLINKEKLREIVKAEEAALANEINTSLSPNLVPKVEKVTDKSEKHKIMIGKPEEIDKLSKSPIQMNKKMISLENHIIPVLIKETKERVTKARLTKARVTKFKKPSFDDNSDSCGDEEIETDFLKINKPLNSNNNLSKMNQSKNNYIVIFF